MLKNIVTLIFFLTAICAQSAEESAFLVSKENPKKFSAHVNKAIDLVRKADLNIITISQKEALASDLENYCLDPDYDDTLQVVYKKITTDIIVNCYSERENQRVKSFYFQVDNANSKLIDALVADTTAEPNNGKKDNLNIIFKEVTTVAGTSIFSALVAQNVFKGQHDKPKHAAVSAFMSSIVTAASYHFFKMSPQKSAVVGFVTSCAIGLTKEIWDKGQKSHTSDINDMKANLIGCALGALGMKLSLEF